jgi:hypothetical protein
MPRAPAKSSHDLEGSQRAEGVAGVMAQAGIEVSVRVVEGSNELRG